MNITFNVNSKEDPGSKRIESPRSADSNFFSALSKYAEIIYPVLEGSNMNEAHLEAKKKAIKEKFNKETEHDEIVGEAMKRISRLKMLEEEFKK